MFDFLIKGDQIVDINGIKITGCPVERIKEVIKESPEYVVCTVKPVTHYSNKEENSPNLTRTAYAELDTDYLQKKTEGNHQDSDDEKHDGTNRPLNYAVINFPSSPEPMEEGAGKKDSSPNYVNMNGEKPGLQNYAELDFSRR